MIFILSQSSIAYMIDVYLIAVVDGLHIVPFSPTGQVSWPADCYHIATMPQ